MANHHMLVVEDHADSRGALAGLFTRMGWHVSVAATIAEALEHLSRRPEPCCIVLDWMLPDGRGGTVLRYVRENGLRSQVVVNTGTILAPDELSELAGLRPDLVMTKPMDIRQIWDGLCRVCENHECETAPA